MKIAAIAKVIKDRGSCRLYRVHGPDDVETKFYIGTNSEIYSLEGFPKPWSEAEVTLTTQGWVTDWEVTTDFNGFSLEHPRVIDLCPQCHALYGKRPFEVGKPMQRYHV